MSDTVTPRCLPSSQDSKQEVILFAMGILTGAQEKIERMALDDALLWGTTIIKIDLLSAGDGTLRVEVIDPSSIVLYVDPAKEKP